MRRAGIVLLTLLVGCALLAPWLSPNAPDERFTDLLYAPPTAIHVLGDGVGAPHIHPWTLISRLGRQFEHDSTRVPLRWFAGGRLVTGDPAGGAPLLLLGADGFGRDIFSRLLHGARTTLAVAGVATAGATLLGLLLGGIAGYARGWPDVVLSRTMEFLLVIPVMYAALAIRAVMPLVPPPPVVFATLTTIFACLGAPIVARGVRAIVLTEREQEYAAAARATGASGARVLIRHLLPAAKGYAAVQATLLLPAFILAEATLSFVSLGFPAGTPSWGTMLQDAANISLLVDVPWILAPAAAIFLVALGANLTVQGAGRPPVELGGPPGRGHSA